TLSMAEVAKVTPQALMHCRSKGDNRRSEEPSKNAGLTASSARCPRSSPSGTQPSHEDRRCDIVGQLLLTSRTRPSQTQIIEGPADVWRRPARVASCQSAGREPARVPV